MKETNGGIKMKEIYVGLIEGEEVCRGSYEYCLHQVGYCNEDGWYIPDWCDCGIIRIQ